MNKVIVSSYALKRYLDKNPFTGCEYVELTLDNNKLHFGNISKYLDVECRPVAFTVTIDISTIYRLKTFLGLISDQPLTLGFDDSGWIFIKEAIL